MLVNKNSPINIINHKKPLSFGSKNSPVEPFVIQTDIGKLRVSEATEKDLKKTAAFSFDVLVESLENWKEYENSSKKEKKETLAWLENDLKRNHSKKDGNTTILIAKDRWNNVKALFDMQSYDECQSIYGLGFEDKRTGYIENCLIAPKYRNKGVGEKMLEKLLPTADNHFTDIFLVARKKAINFYSKMGFKPLDRSKPAVKDVSEFIMRLRSDRRYVVLMTKPLNPLDSCWERLAKILK